MLKLLHKYSLILVIFSVIDNALHIIKYIDYYNYVVSVMFYSIRIRNFKTK